MSAAALDRLAALPRASLGTWPTPLETVAHPRLGTVLVKRDDLAGFGGERRSGVKARKLETFLGHLEARGVDQLLMPLGNITNIGGDLARVARCSGVEFRMLVADDPPLPAAMRQRLFEGSGAESRLIGRSSAGAVLALVAAWAAARLKGRRAFASLPSPAHPSAVAGAACGYVEMMRQAQRFGAAPRSLYVSSAAGSTVAGFALGEMLMRADGAPPVEIVAAQISGHPLRLIVPALIRWTCAHFGLRFGRLNLVVEADPRHAVYGRFDAGHEAVCARVAHEHGLAIDPIYGAKAWIVMEEREAVRPQGERPPLFWHCGYTPDWRLFASRGAAA